VIRRRLLRDKKTGQPEELGASYIPAAIAAGTYLEEPPVVPQALFLCVEELSGRRYMHARDRWLVRPATPEESSLLDLPAGATVIHLVHSAQDETGETLEVSESVWPSGYCQRPPAKRPQPKTTEDHRCGDNFLYGFFKGARLRLPPGAGRARARIES
jgi:DNA-binding GntR family transcriptional regulator